MIMTLPTEDMSAEQRIAMVVGRRMMLRARNAAQNIKRAAPGGTDLMRTVVEKLMAIADNDGVEPKERINALHELGQIAKFGVQVEHDSLKTMTANAITLARSRINTSPEEGGSGANIGTLLNG